MRHAKVWPRPSRSGRGLAAAGVVSSRRLHCTLRINLDDDTVAFGVKLTRVLKRGGVGVRGPSPPRRRANVSSSSKWKLDQFSSNLCSVIWMQRVSTSCTAKQVHVVVASKLRRSWRITSMQRSINFKGAKLSFCVRKSSFIQHNLVTTLATRVQLRAAATLQPTSTRLLWPF